MSKTFKKTDDNTLKITEETVKEVVSTYVYSDLVSIRDGLIQQKDTFNATIDVKIADAQETIDEADALGINKVVPVDDVIDEVIIG